MIYLRIVQENHQYPHESINAQIPVIKRLAQRFRHKENFKKMIRFVFHKPDIKKLHK